MRSTHGLSFGPSPTPRAASLLVLQPPLLPSSRPHSRSHRLRPCRTGRRPSGRRPSRHGSCMCRIRKLPPAWCKRISPQAHTSCRRGGAYVLHVELHDLVRPGRPQLPLDPPATRRRPHRASRAPFERPCVRAEEEVVPLYYVRDRQNLPLL